MSIIMIGTPEEYRRQAQAVLRDCETREIPEKDCLYCGEYTDSYLYVCGECQDGMYTDRLFPPALWIEDL